MGTQALESNNESDIEEVEVSEADLEAALESGFESDGNSVIEEPIKETKKVEDKTLTLNKDKEEPVDEWAGVPTAFKERFEKMEASVAQSNNVANSASGRASKLQAELTRRLEADKPKPLPSATQIKEAMGDPEKLKELSEQWPDMVAGINQGLENVVNGVGKQIDDASANLMKTWEEKQQQSNNTSQKELLDRVKLDIAHSDWQNTINGQSFNGWFYEGGPTAQEVEKYSELRTAESSSRQTHTPEQSAVFAKETNDYYSNLLTKHPKWAEEKGNLYGSPSSDAAIKLLDMHKNFVEAKDKQGKNAKNNRLSENITPTDGRGKAPIENEANAEEAFLNGFAGK